MIRITAGQSIQSVLDKNQSESDFEIEQGSYLGQITLNRPNLSLRSTETEKLPILLSSSPYSVYIPPDVYNTRISQLAIKSTNPQSTLVGIKGSNTSLTSLYLTGDVINGQHRGIEANGDTILIRSCKIDNCFLPDRDAQAICGWNNSRNVVIDSCQLSAGAEAVMFGGADPVDAFAVPRNIKLINSRLTKPVESISHSFAKNSLELKNCINFYCFNCTFEYSGISQGQGGFSIVLTPRNQSGRASYSQVKNVVIEHCKSFYTSGAVTFLGQDDTHPSDTLENVLIRDCEFWLEPFASGRRRIFEFLNSPKNITLQDILVHAPDNQLSSTGYFVKPPINLTLRRIVTPRTKYGWKIDNGLSGLQELIKFAPSTIIDSVSEN